jgi:hypothetical protein
VLPGADTPESIDAAIALAVRLALAGFTETAAAVCGRLLSAAPPGSSSGWLLPVEPALRPSEGQPHWAPVLATLRRNAA